MVAMPKAMRRSMRVERFKRGKIRPGPFRLAFTRFASAASEWLGSHWAFVIAVGVIVVWFATGPFWNWSSEWSLAINTITTVITFLMVFVIQNTQTRDSKAIHLKLDELIRAIPEARNEFMEAEEEDLDEILREKAIVDRADPAPPEDREDHPHDVHHKRERKAS